MEDVDEISAFLRDFVPDKSSSPTESDNIQLRSSIIGGYRLSQADIKPETIDWVMHYLEQRNCPYKLAFVLSEQVAAEIKESLPFLENGGEDETAESESFFDSGLLYSSVVDKLSELCNRYRNEPEDVINRATLVQTQRYQTSINAIKNTRRKMEDRLVQIHDLNATCGLQNMPPQSYYAIFDGHAGVEAASYAAAHLHYNIARHPDFATDIVKAIKEAIVQTDNEFLARAAREGLKGGCTAVCCLIRENMLYVAWLGDSQAVLVRAGIPISLVEPHKPDKESERHRIEQLGGFVVHVGTWRVNGTLAVSRAIGDPEHKPFVSSDADVQTIPLDGSEDFLVLGCDGLWDRLSPQDMALTVYHHVSQKNQDPLTCASQLVQLSKEQGSQDNISGIVVFFKEPRNIALTTAPESTPFTFASNPIDEQNGNIAMDSYIHNNPFKPSWPENPTGRLESGKSIYVYNSGLTVGDPIGSNGPEEIFRPFTGVTLEKTAISELPTPPIEDLVASEQITQQESIAFGLGEVSSSMADAQNAQEIADAIMDSARETTYPGSPFDNMPESNVDDEPDSTTTFIDLAANSGSLGVVLESEDFVPQSKPWMLQVQHSVHQNEVDYLPNPDSAEFLDIQNQSQKEELTNLVSQNPFELGGNLEEIPLETNDNGLFDYHNDNENNPFAGEQMGYSNEGFLQDAPAEDPISNFTEEAHSTLRALQGIQEMIGISETVPGSKAPEPAGMLFENPFNSQKEVYSAFEETNRDLTESENILTPVDSALSESSVPVQIEDLPVQSLNPNETESANPVHEVPLENISPDSALEDLGPAEDIPGFNLHFELNQQEECLLEQMPSDFIPGVQENDNALSDFNDVLSNELKSPEQGNPFGPDLISGSLVENPSNIESTEIPSINSFLLESTPDLLPAEPTVEPKLDISNVADLLGAMTLDSSIGLQAENLQVESQSLLTESTTEISQESQHTLDSITQQYKTDKNSQDIADLPPIDLSAQPASIAVLAPILSMETMIPSTPAAEDTLTAPVVQLGKIPDGVPEADGVTEDVDSDSEKDGGWSYVRGSQKTLAPADKGEVKLEAGANLDDIPLVQTEAVNQDTPKLLVNDDLIPTVAPDQVVEVKSLEPEEKAKDTKTSKPLSAVNKSATKTLTSAASKLSKTEDKTKLKPSPSVPKASPIRKVESGANKGSAPTTPKSTIGTIKKTPSSSTPKILSKTKTIGTEAKPAGITKLAESKPARPIGNTLLKTNPTKPSPTATKEALTKSSTVKRNTTTTTSKTTTSQSSTSTTTTKPTTNGTLRPGATTLTKKVASTVSKPPSVKPIPSASTAKPTLAAARPSTARLATTATTKTVSSTLSRPSTAPVTKKPSPSTQTLPSRGAATSSRPKPLFTGSTTTAGTTKTSTLTNKVTKESANKNIVSKTSTTTAARSSTISRTMTSKTTSGATTKTAMGAKNTAVMKNSEPKPIKRPTAAIAKVDPKENGETNNELAEQIKPISILAEPEKVVETKATEEKFSLDEHTKELQAVDSGLASPESPESPQNGLVHQNGDKVEAQPINQ